MKKIFVLLLLIGLSLSETYAQEIESKDLLLQQVDENQFIRQLTLATEQPGSAIIKQSTNVAYVVQNGNANTVSLNQTGVGNMLNLVQNGNANQYEGLFSGDFNISAVQQEGDGNRLVQSISANGQKFIISQQGLNNELIQIENGTNTLPYQVTQQGEGMRVVIENGGFGPVE
ncbi:hypothetical protein [Pontibacter oryzae]|uniref:Curlin n=1 Tax=Pontibacter oryzae TaxID=2304593 RepID=A0A399RSY3_9BACT|nr:hypothetical protein [Pontibacter oryzae]RIJ33971.1 hypothetical protein D1627_16465 [Pontibacter oryzae]